MDDNQHDDSLKQLWGLILGGSSGFGLASAQKLASKGMNLVVLYREQMLQAQKTEQAFHEWEMAYGVQVVGLNANALDTSSRQTCMDTIENKLPKRSIKVLVHSIARGHLKPLIAPLESEHLPGGSPPLTTEDISLTSYAMANSLLDWVRALLEAELFHDDGRVIGLTSEGAHKHWPGYAAVSIAKASLESLATYMAVEFARHGLKTNLIQAGVTETPSLKRIPGSETLIRVAAGRNPMGRLTQTGDVADVIYLLCRPESFWINGALIHVDGGEHCC
jgi:enoyl-[acyl-carrier protein] reductase III